MRSRILGGMVALGLTLLIKRLMGQAPELQIGDESLKYWLRASAPGRRYEEKMAWGRE